MMAKRNLTKALKSVVDFTLKGNANSTTCINIYQPKAPEGLKKFSKTNNDK